MDCRAPVGARNDGFFFFVIARSLWRRGDPFTNVLDCRVAASPRNFGSFLFSYTYQNCEPRKG